METLLIIDTATPAGSVAVSRGRTLLGEVLLNVKATHTDRLLATVSRLLGDLALSLDAIDGFAVVRGPGSFTGLRVGMATVKGLALATGKPVYSVSTLQALAVQAPACAYPVCALLDARKKEVYTALYDWQNDRPVLRGEERVVAPERLLAELAEGTEDVLFIGDGTETYRGLIVERLGERAHFAPWCFQAPRAAAAAFWALDALRRDEAVPLEQLTPLYIRRSEAEIMLEKRQNESSIQG